MGKCAICNQKLPVSKNLLTGTDDTLYCENCRVFELKDETGI